MKLGRQPRKWLDKKSKLGFRGYPVGTIVVYGPDDRHASKAAVAVVVAPDTEPVALRRWFAESGDIRNDATFEEIALFLRGHEVRMRKGLTIRKARPVLIARSGPVATIRLSYSWPPWRERLAASFSSLLSKQTNAFLRNPRV
jgi:hypothetical protein